MKTLGNGLMVGFVAISKFAEDEVARNEINIFQ